MKHLPHRTLRISALGAVLAIALSACASGSDTAADPSKSSNGLAGVDAATRATLNDLYESAKASGDTQVTLYTAYASDDPEAGLGHVLRTFEKTYPGLKVNESLLSGAQLFSRVDGEFASGKPTADAVLSGPSDVGYFVNNDKLVPYDPPTASEVPADLKEPGHLYNVPFQSLFGLVYNTNKIKKEDVPTTLAEVVSGKYDGEVTFGQPVGTSPSSFSLTSLSFNDRLDESLLQKLNTQVPRKDRYASVVDAVGAVAQGRYSIAIWGPSQVAAIQKSKGAPIAVGNLSDARVLNGPGFGIFKDAPSKDATQLLEAWLFTKTAQKEIAKYAFNYGTVPGAPAPDGFPDISDYDLKTIPATTFSALLEKDGPRWEKALGAPKS